MSTKQGLLLSIRGVIAQGEKSATGGSCKYRLGELKCALGMLIPDEKYTKELETRTLHAVSVKKAVPREYKSSSRWKDYLDRLQCAHDNADEGSFVPDFKDRISIDVRDGYLPKYCLEAL